MPRTLTRYEQETIISFNKAEDVVYIFGDLKAIGVRLNGCALAVTQSQGVRHDNSMSPLRQIGSG